MGVGGVEIAAGVTRLRRPSAQIHPDLAVLLTTSGSTGSPKLVRLSRSNIASNTAAIIRSLGLSASDRAILTLPLFYSYGMSVVLTHLSCGGSVVVTRSTLMEAAFWDAVRDYRPTFLNGVPATFEILRRLRFEQMDVPSIRSMTQAGGRMEATLIEEFGALMEHRDGGLFVMYGQTEASPRMTCLPPGWLSTKPGSVGPALQGGRLTITDLQTGGVLPVGSTGQVRYEGPNVMMGYATGEEDLAAGDVMGSGLDTGDIGYLDEDGCLFIAGRLKRIAKVNGERLSLDEIEGLVEADVACAMVAGGPDEVIVFCVPQAGKDLSVIRRRLSQLLRIPLRAIPFREIDAIPRTAAGKIDYGLIERMAIADESS